MCNMFKPYINNDMKINNAIKEKYFYGVPHDFVTNLTQGDSKMFAYILKIFTNHSISIRVTSRPLKKL